MGIDVSWQDENGKEIQFLVDPNGELSRLFVHSDHSKYQLIKYIDPFGDTIFNQSQIPDLRKELESAIKMARKEEELRSVLKLVGASEGKTHTFVKFIGD